MGDGLDLASFDSGRARPPAQGGRKDGLIVSHRLWCVVGAAALLAMTPPTAARIAAQGSGVTVHGSATTHFKYVLTNTVRDGRLITGSWPTAELTPGDYTLRITARDYSGNVAGAGRDLKITLQ